MPVPSPSAKTTHKRWVGRSVARVEDEALVRGLGQYADDLAVPRALTHAAFLRSPHAHAELRSVDATAAAAHPGIIAVLTGPELAAIGKPFITGVKTDAPHYPLAIDRVRYMGEPVAVVIATSRYVAEDALELIEVDYAPLPAVVTPGHAATDQSVVLHPGAGSNVLHERQFRYGDPEAEFAAAAHVVTVDTVYPRNACTPIECNVVQASFHPGEQLYDVVANFQGPYTLHTVMARSLGVPGNRLRLRTPPDSGGSFGVKQSVFPYVVAIGLAARLVGQPVKWVEDRLEHLSAATSATNRVTKLRGAFDVHGTLLALDYDQLEDCGAYLRAPEPATLYRMHGNMTGAYAVQNLAIHNRVVVTNKTPTGLNRGFGGPQVYFPLERLMDKAAATLGVDRVEIRRRNLVPADAMPYRTASGALLDSGDYAHSLECALGSERHASLLERQRERRAAGRLYGIGYAAVVEPSVSNMGYITTLMTPAERERAGPKNGALATATVNVDPAGSVTVHAASIPQGQGHKTVLAQVVADVLGIGPHDIVVLMDHDTGKDPWSIASGNYSSRFAAVVAGAAHRAALTIRARIAAIAAADLNVPPVELEFRDGFISSRHNPDNRVPLARTAAKAHWSPLAIPAAAGAGLRETATWTMPELTEPDAQDRVNSSGAHGFIFDLCGVEIDAVTGQAKVDRYITMHDAGTLLNPQLADGQVRGAFAQGLGAALLESFEYQADGSFASGTLADYLPPTACEVPDLEILHDPHPSPLTPLGAKGLGEGNCMSTPVCIANAVADALQTSVDTLPLNPARVHALMQAERGGADDDATPTAAPGSTPEDQLPAALHPAPETAAADDGHGMTGEGSTTIRAAPDAVWSCLNNPGQLRALLPGCKAFEQSSDGEYRAELSLGVGPVRGLFDCRFRFTPVVAGAQLRIDGGATGALGASSGTAIIRLDDVLQPDGASGTRLDYRYSVTLTGKVAAVGGRLLDGASRTLIGQMIKALASAAEPEREERGTWASRLGAGLRSRWSDSGDSES
ncbi:MAG: molybdopterin cofactor-binding domain-containing protein [Pseudomonadota bacterium]